MISGGVLDLVRRANRRLWSPATPDRPARAVIRAAGTGFGAGSRESSSLLDKAWAELAWAGAQSGNAARLRALAGEGARPHAVIGDSHSRLLVRRARRADGAWLTPLWWLETGASARGLGRSDARSGAGQRVRVAIDTALAATPTAPVFVKFGQVDVEFVQVFKRLERGQKGFDADVFKHFVDETIGRYVTFLAGATAPADRARVHVCSLFPPTLSDAAWRTGYINAHIIDLHGPAGERDLASALEGLEMPDLAARTVLHADFNAALADAASAQGLAFSDNMTAFLGADGVVEPRYVGPAAGQDHHLDFHASRAPMVDCLWRVFDGSHGQA